MTSNIAAIIGHTRLRRPRATDWSRRMVRENHLTVNELIWPSFVIEGQNEVEAVPSMPGVERLSVDRAVEAARMAADLGVPAIAIFPNTPDGKRSAEGDESCNPDNLVNRATRAI